MFNVVKLMLCIMLSIFVCRLDFSILILLYLQMSEQNDYDNDVLTLDDDIDFNALLNPDTRNSTANHWKIVARPAKVQQQEDAPKPILRLTPHTAPTLTQPAIINGREITNLQLIKATTTIQEVCDRAENCYQKFITKEGTILYFDRELISKIDFEGCRKRRCDKTLNLPGNFQVRLRVAKNGQITLIKYHRRGQSKYNSNYPY